MRLAFMGSPDFSVPILHALVEAGHEVAAVYCQPPRPVGRGNRLTPCPVHRAAEVLALPIFTPARLRKDEAAQAGFVALGLEAAVVAAYGLLLPRAMLDAPARGCLNVHASLLPRWRGAAPIQAAILAGDTQTGVTIMRMEQGLDTGPMLLSEATPIGPRDTAADLHDRLSTIGARLILHVLATDPVAVVQPEQGVTHVGKITKADGRLDWNQDASALERRVRAYHPWPGAFFDWSGEAIRVLEAEVAEGSGRPGTVLDDAGLVACGHGTALRLARLQRPGRGSLATDAFLRGFGLPAGSVLG